jgi:hypothetical protein
MATKKQQAKPTSEASSNLDIPPASNAWEVPSVYANTFEILSMNHIDIRFGFNEVQLETGGGEIKTVRRANIVMPIPAFMIMLQLLNVNAKRLMETGQQQAQEMQAHLRAIVEAGDRPKVQADK